MRGDTERTLNICDCSNGSGKITGAISSGIGVARTTVLNMYGGRITGNNGGILIGTDGHFNMYGGEISDNTLTSYSSGAGVQNNGTFIMMGGSITDNRIAEANYHGGGVYSASDAIIKISGNAVIKNNINIDKPSNLHLASNGTTDAKITVGELGSNASIGVSVDSNHGMIISNGGKDYADKFFSDNGAYAVAVDGEDLELLETEVHVGQAVLKNGEYTTDGQSTTTTKPESGGYAHFENGVLTLHNFTYSGGGYYLSAIYCNHALTIKVEGENSITRVVTATDEDTKMALRGIRVENGKLTIIGDSKDDSLRVVVDGHDDVSASGIYGDTAGIDIYNCTLEARSVNGGKGLNAPGNITITGAKVIGASEATATSLNNQGIYAGILKVTNSDVIGIADNTSPGRATGIYLDASKSKLIFESGTIIGEVSDALGNSYAIYIHTNAATLPANYWMRTSASGDFVEGTWDGANVGPYFELTTTEPHIHSYTRKTNDTQHWMECDCGTVQDGSLEDHKGGTATCQTKAKCSECGEEYGDYGAHNWDADWTTDSEKHWHKCLNTGCTEIKDDNLHSGGSATCKDLAKCEFCDMAYGEPDGDNHRYSATLTWTDDEHFYECSLCSAKKDKALHDFTDDCDETCNTCEYVRVITHAFDKLEKDTDGHWYICSVCGVEAPEGKEAHSGGTASCKDLAKCEFCDMAYGALANHEYESGKCSVCDAADPNDPSDIPQTGDNSQIFLWAGLVFVSALGTVALAVFSTKKRRH